MKNAKLVKIIGVILFGLPFLILGESSSSLAGGCFSTTPNGECVKWDQNQPVVWRPESGALKGPPSEQEGGGGGSGGCWLFPEAKAQDVGNAQAVQIIQDAFNRWMSVPNSDLTIQQGGSLPDGGDVNLTNIENFWTGSFITGDVSTLDPSLCYDADPNNDQNCGPIIFDHSGLVTQAIQGLCAHCDILGFAAILPQTQNDPPQFTISSPVLRNAQAVLSGACLEPAVIDPNCGNCCPAGIDLNTAEGVMTHELGHFLGLDHTLVNKDEYLKCTTQNCSNAELELIPTMIGLFVPGADLKTLHYDDMVTFAGLYPAAGGANTCTIRGNAQTSANGSGRCFEVIANRTVSGNVNDPPSKEFAAGTVAGAFEPRNSQGVPCPAGVSYSSCVGQPGASNDLKVHTNCTTGANCGNFLIEGLDPGTYKIGVQAFQANGNPSQPIDFVLEPCTPVRTYSGTDNTAFDLTGDPNATPIVNCPAGGDITLPNPVKMN